MPRGPLASKYWRELFWCPYGQNNYRTLGASDVKRVAASPLPFFTKNRLIVFEQQQPAPDYLIEQDNDRRRRVAGPTLLGAVEFVLPFTPRLVGKNAGLHPAARGIVPLPRCAFPQSVESIGWWILLDDFVQYGSSLFYAMSDRQKR
jgi:hypothetical protein